MSNLKLTIDKNAPCAKKFCDIPKNTYFTGHIFNSDSRAFFKGYSRIFSLETGEQWEATPVECYVECNATINLEPVR